MKRRFIITGASKCIGLALASRLAAQGDEVIGIYFGNTEGLAVFL